MRITTKHLARPSAGLELKSLYRLLSAGKSDISAIWNAGEWLDKHFDREHAGHDAVANLATNLNKIGKKAPTSVNHLHKCRQFRRVITKSELALMEHRRMSWRRAIRLLGVKTLIDGMPSYLRTQAKQEFRKLIKDFPGSSASKFDDWVQRVEEMRRSRRKRNQIVQKLKLLKECSRAAVFRLRSSVQQFQKMKEFLPRSKHAECRNLLSAARTLIENIEKLYKEAQTSAKDRKSRPRSLQRLQPYETILEDSRL
jgi:hypothetical protein